MSSGEFGQFFASKTPLWDLTLYSNVILKANNFENPYFNNL